MRHCVQLSPELSEFLMERSLEAGSSLYPPQNLLYRAMDLKLEGQRPILVSYKYDWLLMREPSYDELMAYTGFRSHAVDKETRKDYLSRSIEAANIGGHVEAQAIAWLIIRCMVYPDGQALENILSDAILTRTIIRRLVAPFELNDKELSERLKIGREKAETGIIRRISQYVEAHMEKVGHLPISEIILRLGQAENVSRFKQEPNLRIANKKDTKGRGSKSPVSISEKDAKDIQEKKISPELQKQLRENLRQAIESSSQTPSSVYNWHKDNLGPSTMKDQRPPVSVSGGIPAPS